jgi:nucleolar complex protein 3
LDEAQAAKLAAAANAKKRKRNKEEAEIESELKEGSSSVDKIVLARAQSDTLQAVTLVYFAILKSDHCDSNLLPSALEGLAKFAHLINFETVVDLLEVLKTLLKRVDDLSLDASLQCILTAFQTLEGPGRELKIDQKEYITPLYSQLPRYVAVNVGNTLYTL